MNVRVSRTWTRLLAVFMLACLLVHGTAVQTHIHFSGQMRLAAAISGQQVIQAAKGGNGSDDADCPLCQEAAMAGAYLLPPAIALPPTPTLLQWCDAATLRALGLLESAHAWRSRAPPR